MDGNVQDNVDQVEVDPWTAAFEALNKRQEGNSGEDDHTETTVESENNTRELDGNGVGSDNADGIDDQNMEGVDGGQDDTGDLPSGQSGDSDSVLAIDDEEISRYRESIHDEIRDRVIGEIADEFVKRNILNNNGKLGASLDNPLICKYDDDKMPHFYNPETGREFTGDNPRRQAQEWCEDYNREVAKAFNNACRQYEEQLMEQEEPSIRVLEFASKYDKLDPIRQRMFDNVVENYEIEDDDGNVIGYTCDLDMALSLVDKNVRTIQEYAMENKAKVNEKTGPELDMKNSSGAVQSTGKPEFKSVAEAMEWQQDQLLESMRKGK